jgi:CBS domain containing-hemolysin-like protein
MFHLMGHIPTEGETVEVDGLVLRADRVQGRRIRRVRVSRRDGAPVLQVPAGPIANGAESDR